VPGWRAGRIAVTPPLEQGLLYLHRGVRCR